MFQVLRNLFLALILSVSFIGSACSATLRATQMVVDDTSTYYTGSPKTVETVLQQIGSVVSSTKMVPQSGTYASKPASPVNGQIYVVTDAFSAGSCTAGAGSSLSLCRWNGSTWASVGDGGGGGSMVYPGAGIPNSTGSAWTTSYSTSGSGAVILLATSPTLVTPILGAATATSINKLTITQPATSAVLTILNGKTLTANNTLTLAGTDSTVMTFPSTSATIARTDAANTFTGHQTIEGVTATGATGSGKMVYDTAPTFNTSITMADVANFIFNVTTGTKIGTATGQKIGFWNATPIVQPSGNICTAMTALGLITSCTESGGGGNVGTSTSGYYAQYNSTTSVTGIAKIPTAGVNWIDATAYIPKDGVNWADMANLSARTINWQNIDLIVKTVGTVGTGVGGIQMFDNSGTNWMKIQPPSTIAVSKTWTFPVVDGSNGQCFKTDGSGTISIGACGSGTPGGSNTQLQYNNSGVLAGITNATTDGTTLTSTSPKIVTNIKDTNGNIMLAVTPTASAVNYLTLVNQATTVSPELQATGSDTNLNIKLTPKGTGGVVVTSSSTISGVTGDGTHTLDINGNGQTIRLGDGGVTNYVSVPTTGIMSFTGTAGIIPNSGTYASRPGSPATGQIYIITDATSAGTCTAGGGSALSLCRYNGSAWVSIGDGTSGGSMVYPGAGIANSTGSAWGTSYTTSGSSTVLALTTSPVFTTPTLGVASATSVNKLTLTTPATGSTLTILDGKTLTANNSITLAGTDSTVMTFPSTSATIARTDAANTFTGVQTMTSPAITTPAITGISSGSGVATAGTASTLALRDSNANLTANNHIQGYTTTATAGGTTTITVSSTALQVFTGSSNQTLQMPVTSTLVLGQQYFVYNNSTGAITVNSSGSNAIVVIPASSWATLTCILTSGTTASSWDYKLDATLETSGKSLSVSNTLTLAGTDGTTMTFPSTSATIARTDAANTFTGVQTMTSPVLTTPNLGTPSALTLTNATGLPISGLTASTSTALGVGSLELGHASDTTLSRSAAGVLAVEGVVIPSISSTNTITNKRNTKRDTTTTQSATPTINTDNSDHIHITGLAQAITSMTTNLTGTPVAGDTLWIDITDNGTARAITWGTSFEASTAVALPTTTVISTRLDIGFIWNEATSKWRCIASS